VTERYLAELANEGIEQALAKNESLRKGLTTYQGKLTSEPVANAHQLPLSEPEF
jgi:alanine dehydrogenase